MSHRYVIAKGPSGPFFCTKGWTDSIWKCRFYKSRGAAAKHLLALEEEENRGKIEYPFVELFLLTVDFITVGEPDDLSAERKELILKTKFKKIK